jgi:hypothetical protein
MGPNQANGWQSVPVGSRFLTVRCDNRWIRHIRQCVEAIDDTGCQIRRFPASLPVPRYPLPRRVVRIVRRAVEMLLPGGRGFCRAKAKLGWSLALPLETWQIDFNPPRALEAFRLWKRQ